MDDIVDLESEKIDLILEKIDADPPESEEVKYSERNLWKKIQRKTMQGRRTGVGITAEGDMLAALGIRYGTDEGNDFSEKVHRVVALNAYASSVEMAKERGALKFTMPKEKNNPFINRLKEADPDLYEDMVKYGRRNIALLTIAPPTGTTSLMSQIHRALSRSSCLYTRAAAK